MTYIWTTQWVLADDDVSYDILHGMLLYEMYHIYKWVINMGVTGCCFAVQYVREWLATYTPSDLDGGRENNPFGCLGSHLPQNRLKHIYKFF